ncbi:MAG TPA: flagellar biosynthesis protein FlgB [Caulobacteraceae bacterium]|jgi:flagellar basal-body rod protein FlgB
MNLDTIPLFSMIRSKLSYLGQRQELIAGNVAQASTPGYTPKDLAPFQLQGSSPSAAAVGVARTSPAHLAGARPGPSAAGYKPVQAPDSDTTLDGNRVVLEEQMLKLTEARLQHDAAIGFYQKSLNILRLAARPPGRSA